MWGPPVAIEQASYIYRAITGSYTGCNFNLANWGAQIIEIYFFVSGIDCFEENTDLRKVVMTNWQI